MPRPITVLVGGGRVAAGLRDKRVTIQQVTDSVSPSQMPIETWSDLMTVQMSRLDSLADERFTASQEGAWTQTQWHGPYIPALDPELIDAPKVHRLVHEGRIFNIRTATTMPFRRGIEYITLAGAKLPE